MEIDLVNLVADLFLPLAHAFPNCRGKTNHCNAPVILAPQGSHAGYKVWVSPFRRFFKIAIEHMVNTHILSHSHVMNVMIL
jgi:hypothetical protein